MRRRRRSCHEGRATAVGLVLRALRPGAETQAKGDQADVLVHLRIADAVQARWQRQVEPLPRRQRQAFVRKAGPVEAGAGVDLAAGGHVGMADHAARADLPAGHDLTQQAGQPVHLAQGKGAVAGIGDLDPDGAGIDVIAPLPGPRTRVPGPAILGDQGLGTAILMDQPMCADLGQGVAQPRARLGRVGHAGIVQHDQFGALTPAVAVVGAGKAHAHSGGWSPARMDWGTITTGAFARGAGAVGTFLTTRTRFTPIVGGIGTGLWPAISAAVGA